MRERLTFAVDHEVISIHYLCKWLIRMSEDANSVLKQWQPLILLYESQVNLLLELREGIQLLHCAVL